MNLFLCNGMLLILECTFSFPIFHLSSLLLVDFFFQFLLQDLSFLSHSSLLNCKNAINYIDTFVAENYVVIFFFVKRKNPEMLF